MAVKSPGSAFLSCLDSSVLLFCFSPTLSSLRNHYRTINSFFLLILHSWQPPQLKQVLGKLWLSCLFLQDGHLAIPFLFGKNDLRASKQTVVIQCNEVKLCQFTYTLKVCLRLQNDCEILNKGFFFKTFLAQEIIPKHNMCLNKYYDIKLPWFELMIYQMATELSP